MLGVVVQGAHGRLQHGSCGDVLAKHLAVLRRHPREPAGHTGQPCLEAERRRAGEPGAGRAGAQVCSVGGGWWRGPGQGPTLTPARPPVWLLTLHCLGPRGL